MIRSVGPFGIAVGADRDLRPKRLINVPYFTTGGGRANGRYCFNR